MSDSRKRVVRWVGSSGLFIALVFFLNGSGLGFDVDVSSIWHRPYHFLYPFLFLAFWVLLDFVDSEIPRHQKRVDLVGLGLAVVMAGLLWTAESAFDFRAGNWVALAVYFIPTVLYHFMAYAKRKNA